MPVTVMVYDPLGVPVPPPPLGGGVVELPPPQATRKMQAAMARMRSMQLMAFFLLDAPTPAVLSSIAGRSSHVA